MLNNHTLEMSFIFGMVVLEPLVAAANPHNRLIINNVDESPHIADQVQAVDAALDGSDRDQHIILFNELFDFIIPLIVYLLKQLLVFLEKW